MDVELPDGQILKGVPDGTTKADIAQKLQASGRPVPAEWLAPKAEPKPAEPEKPSAASVYGKAVAAPLASGVGAAETALQAGTGFVAQAAGGLRGIYDVATGQGADKASQDVQSTTEALTYQPKTEAGQQISGAVQYPFKKLAEGADWAGEKAAQVTGSPAVGAAVNTGIQSIPGLVGAKLGVAGKAETAAGRAAAAVPAATKAAQHVKSIGLDWGSLAQATRATLTKVAESSQDLKRLDPKAIERVDRANKAGVPITRGQATRDLSQLTQEENIVRADAGSPIRDVKTQQDIGLHGKLDTLRKDSGGKADTRAQLGASVQEATRGKLRSLEADYRLKYRKAKQAGETAAPVDPTALHDFLQVPANKRNAGFLQAALDDYKQADGSIRINDLEQVRKEATVKAGSLDKTEAHYAKGAVQVIDKILDDAGGSAYKTARKAFAKTREEFDRQGLVSKLTKEKGRTNDRAVALEDTFDTVVRKGTNEQLQGLIESLTKGGNVKTKAAGGQAVKDLQAATIDYLKEKAAGKRGITGEQEQLQFNSTFIDAVDELDKDGKLQTLFGPGAVKELRDLRAVTRDLRTTPADRIAGPNTTPRLIAAIEKLSHVPYLGTSLKGVVAGGKKIAELGKKAREEERAVTNPLDAAAQSAGRQVKRTARRKATLRELTEAGSASTATLGQLPSQ